MGLQGNTDQVPSVGWTWMTRSLYDDQSWEPDRQIKVESPSAPCPSVEVILEGEALEKKRLCSGIYHIVDGMWSAGRQVRSIANNLKFSSLKVYKQERGGAFYLLVRPQNVWLERGAKWAVVDSINPNKHEIYLWSKTGGTHSPADNLDTGDQKGSWYFNNATKDSGYFMAEGDITVNCVEQK